MSRTGGHELRIRPDAPPGQWRAVVLIVLAVAAGGAVIATSMRGSSVPVALLLPAWAPRGPIDILWLLPWVPMAAAAMLAWRTLGRLGDPALALFFAQLAAQAGWSWLLFQQHTGIAALAAAALAWMLLVATLHAFWHAHRIAALLLLPCLALAGYAVALTAALLRLNPALLQGSFPA
jgi:tryptophan-rich sensory protein